MDDATRPGLYEAFALLAAFAIFLLARANRLTFPLPWNDEARFYLPALWLVQHGSLNPVVLNAPAGIFWVPDGFTVFLGLVLRLFGQSIGIARIACECLVAAGVACFALAFRKISGSGTMGALATLLLLTPPVVFAANMVRMEAPVFLLIAVALLLHLDGYFLGAGALLFGSLLFHPALGLAAVGYVAFFWALCRKSNHWHWGRGLERLLLALVLLCWLSEGLHIARHVSLFKIHMAYQIAQKMRWPLIARLRKPQAVILFFSIAAIAAMTIRRRVWESLRANQDFLGTVIIALGVETYAVLGAELTYDVYSLSLAPAAIFCLIARDLLAATAEPVLDPATGNASMM